jgi:GT2 family glycosyltransferase
MKRSPEPFVSLVIPTYQRCASVERLLQALNQQSLAAEKYEVIVVIDGSIDGTREMLDRAQTPFRLKSIWQTNQGRASACNRGIRAARGSLVVLLDDDMEPSPQLLDAHWNAHMGNPRLGVLGAVPIRLEPSSPPIMQFIGAKFNQHLEKLAQSGYTLNLRDFYSGNFSARRMVLMEVGLFDENYKIYGNEDLDLSWRLRQAGIQLVYNAEASATQNYEKDYAALARDNIAKGKTSILLARLHPEVLPEIKLSTYNQESKKWRLVRTGLLFLSRFIKSIPTVIIHFMSWLEKRHPAQLQLYYRLSLDYFYWLGVRNAGL